MKRLMVIITTLFVVTGLGFFTETTYASPENDLKNKQQKVKDERSEVKKNLSKADEKLADLLFDLKELNEEIVAVDDALKHNKKMVEDTEKDIESSEKAISDLEEEIAQIEADIKYRNNLLKQRLSSLHKSGGATQYLEVILGSKSFMDFVSRVTAVSQIANKDFDLIDKQEEDKILVVEKHSEVENKLTEQKELKEELDGIQVLITDQQKENKGKKKTLQKKEKELKTLKAELEDKDSSLASLEAEIRRDITNARTQRSSSPSSVASTANDADLTQLNSRPSNSNAPSNPSGMLGAILEASRPHYGTPYRWAGRTPSGFDCSGFVSWAFGQVGVNIPPSTAGLSGYGQRIHPSQMQPGDIVFFDTYKTNGHVGIYLGNDTFLGAQNSTGLAEASMNSSYWKPRFKGHVRRVN